MFRRFHEKLKEREDGFTLIELLVVILIIAILAAIAIPVFLRQREKGYRSQVQSALKNAATAMESYATQSNGDYEPMAGASCVEKVCDPLAGAAEGANFPDQGFQGSAGVTVTVASADATTFCLEGSHESLEDDAVTFIYASGEGEPVDSTGCGAV